ncbi:hypothetical protein BJV82DRAFT_119511 [Fennellomyces sp. T-0311]|nr:hypothetical protein BJV82DRAFT_119511 [Fennellomyces sp. T-0311]
MLSQEASSSAAARPATKSHVLRACVNCRKAHLACDTDRPCRRCVSLGKEQTCYDVDHKKRGRPKLRPNGQRVQKHAMTTPMRQSSFAMTANAATVTTQTFSAPIVTAFLSMEVCCARVSDEIQPLLGYYPQELAHRPLFSFIAPRSSETLARLHRVLLDNITHVAQRADPTYQRMPPTERTTSDKFFSHHPDTLTSIANGSQTVADTLWVKRNDGAVEPLVAQFYLGGGLGADLYTPSTLTSLYIVCLLSRPGQTQQQQVRQQSEQPVPVEEQSSSSLPAPSTSLSQTQRPVAPRQSQASNESSSSTDQPVLLTHPSRSTISLRSPWQQVHVAPITNKEKSTATMDYVRQSMRLFQNNESSRQSNMSVDALLS